jgi:serine phosphatase RsbU (regulator of sigma subunit)
MDAALLATVLVGACATRADGVELEEQARLANDGLADQVSEGQFVTGLLVRIDLATATAAIVNAGHPPPLRLREAGRARSFEADPPFGTEHGRDYRVQALPLEVGDRLMFVTDGMLEREPPT